MRLEIVFAVILGLLMTSSTKLDPCDDYNAAKAKLNDLKVAYNNESTRVTQADVAGQAAEVASFMQECYDENPTDLPDILVIRAYKRGMIHYDAEDYDSASFYFRKCIDLPLSDQYYPENRTKSYRALASSYYRIVREQVGRTRGSTMAFVRISFGSPKLGISDEIMDAIEFDQSAVRNWTSEELEELVARKSAISTTSKSAITEMVSNIAGSKDVFVSAPFVVVSSSHADMAKLQPKASLKKEEKGSIGKPEKGDFFIAQQSAVVDTEPKGVKSAHKSKVVAKNAQRFYKYLQGEYIDAKIDHYIPIYSFSGRYNGDGYVQFSEFAKKVHMIPPAGSFAYFNYLDNSLMVWLSSGFGTLNHEITHALLRADFPQIPGWLDEGMASLQEETTGKKFKPLHNYRLGIVQEALNSLTCFPSLREVMAYPKEEFSIAENARLNAAISRYMVFYFEDQGKLSRIYKDLRAAGEAPDSHFERVLEVLGMQEAELETSWKAWVNSQAVPAVWESTVESAARYVSTINCTRDR